MMQQIKSSPYLIWIGLISLVILILFVHIWRLDDIPRGLYVDETSIGLNAASIATTFRDEHGKFLPIYFEAFGEYKNPLYIYTASLLFLIFGINDFALRMTSFLFFLIFFIGFIVLTKQLFPHNKHILGYSLLAAGFLPWIFTLSRISFEVISQPAVMVWAVYFYVRTYADLEASKYQNLSAIIAGALIGVSVYTYSTSRVLSFAFLLSILLIYYQRRYWRSHAWVILSAGVSLIPYVLFSLSNPGALTHRFSLLTYIYNAQLSLLDKASIFLTNYFSYLDLDFLLINGDLNLRHHSGMNGEIYFAVIILFIIGIWSLTSRFGNTLSDKRIALFLLFNLISAPVAAALTEPNHSLRSVMVGIYILVISLYGFTTLQKIRFNHLRYFAIGTILVLLIVQSSLYLHNYFNSYVEQSITAFESYDFKHDLLAAEAYQPQDIIVTKYANQPYAHLEYYKYQIPLSRPAYIAEPLAAPKRCIIYFAGGEHHLDNKGLEIEVEDLNYYSRLRCY